MWKWKGKQGQGETEAMIPNMMYMSREQRTQANTHQKGEEKGRIGHGKGGTIVSYGTVRPCHFAVHKNCEGEKEARLEVFVV